MSVSSAYTAICSSLLFPVHEWYKGHSSPAVRREMERTQWWSGEKLRELQVSRLKNLLTHAREYVPYYRQLFEKCDFDPGRIAAIEDLGRLPFLTKDLIRANATQLLAKGASRVRRFSTTGSSGDPLLFYVGRDRVSHDVAAKWRATRWWGVDIGDPEIVAWSSPIEIGAQDRVRRIRDRLLRSRLIPTHALSPELADRFLHEVRAFKPRMLFGYPSSLAFMAHRAAERGVRMNDLGIAVAFVTAERVYPHQRDVIRRVFGCPVADGYGGRDSGFIAHECPEGGLHITAEDIIVEIVDAEGRILEPGQAGDVVITQLFTREFPFVRYKNGDVAVLHDKACICGRGLPLIRQVQGRTNDFLVTESGGKVHDVAFAMVLRDMPGVRQFKIVQESIHIVRLELVVGQDFDVAMQTPKIESVFRHHLGARLRLSIDLVPRIAPEPSGKYRYVVSRVEQSH